MLASGLMNVGKDGLAAVAAFAIATFLLAYGGAMVCCVPCYPGESLWQRERIIYGLIPLCGSITLFALIALLWIRLCEISIRAVYRTTFYLLAASLAVIWVGTIIAVLIHSGT